MSQPQHTTLSYSTLKPMCLCHQCSFIQKFVPEPICHHYLMENYQKKISKECLHNNKIIVFIPRFNARLDNHYFQFFLFLCLEAGRTQQSLAVSANTLCKDTNLGDKPVKGFSPDSQFLGKMVSLGGTRLAVATKYPRYI